MYKIYSKILHVFMVGCFATLLAGTEITKAEDNPANLKLFENSCFSVLLPENFFAGIVIKDSMSFSLNLTGKQFYTFFNGGPVEFHLSVKAYESKNLKEGVEKVIVDYNKMPDDFFYNPEKFKNNPPKEIPEFWLKEYFEPITESRKCSTNNSKFVLIKSRNYEKGIRLYHTRYDFACWSKSLNKTVVVSFLIKHCDKTFSAEKDMEIPKFMDTVSQSFCPKQ